MDPKITKKTQDSLGKYIKKPPLTEKLLSKPPFRFLHDVMTSVIKTTGVMKGLYTDSEMNSENVKDKDSKIAFLQKAVDYVGAASGKQLSVKPAKIVAGHEPEKTNEFLQALATAIGSKVNNDEVLDSMNNKGKSSSKKEEKEERPKEREREKSTDRRKRDEDKKGREEKDRSKDRDDRRRDRDDKHKDRDDRHKDRDDRHKDREDRHKDKDRDDKHRDRDDKHKDRDRERGKSGRSRPRKKNEQENSLDAEIANCATPNDIDSDLLFSENEIDNGILPGNATFCVGQPSQVFPEDLSDSPQAFIPIPRQVSTYQEMKKASNYGDREEDFESGDTEAAMSRRRKGNRMRRPKGARLRPNQHGPTTQESMDSETPSSPFTPYVSEEENARFSAVGMQHADAIVDKLDELGNEKNSRKKKSKSGKGKSSDNQLTREKVGSGKYPKTSTPNDSPLSPKKDHDKHANVRKRDGKATPVKGKHDDLKLKDSPVVKTAKSGNRLGNKDEPNLKKMAYAKKHASNAKNKKSLDLSSKENEPVTRNSLEYESQNIISATVERSGKNKSARERRRSREMLINEGNVSPKKTKEKVKYRNDDYAHEKIKKSRQEKYEEHNQGKDTGESCSSGKENEDAYFVKKQPHGVDDKRKRSSFTSISEQHRREEQEKENDAPKENMVNGDHKSSDAPSKPVRPTSAKGSRRRMEDLPSAPGRKEATLGDDDIPPQVAAGRLARPSSARPAPPKRKEDAAQSEPAMRLGSGKPQNLILDDGKDSDEDETFVVEDAAPQHVEPEQAPAPVNDDDDEDHGGLVKKIMESKKEYEQPRETKIERPTISDAQRRKQREAVQREIDKLRGSIQTLTRSANPLGKIMDYVQEDLDSMQKELEKWKEENKEHGLALKREKAITERAVEPLRVQLSEVDQAIKDQLELIGAVKSNIIRNDQKMEKMLRTIAKS